jgi:hypothetical protein
VGQAVSSWCLSIRVSCPGFVLIQASETIFVKLCTTLVKTTKNPPKRDKLHSNLLKI